MTRYLLACLWLYTSLVFSQSAQPLEVVFPNPLTESVWMKAMGVKQERFYLENGVAVWIIEDAKAPRSVMAVSIAKGSMEDPEQMMGGAHLLEHMVFMGSEKFPEESGFHDYIKQVSGTTNATTAPGATTFALTCNNPKAEETFERLSDMIQHPLLKQECIDREKQAVNEEFRQKISYEGYRNYLIQFNLLEPSHPLYKLACGNTDTLQNVTSDDLKQWHQNHYLPKNTTIILLTPHDLQPQKQWVTTLWQGWKRGSPKAPKPVAPPKIMLDRHQLAKATSLEGKNTLSLAWYLPLETPQDQVALRHVSYWLGQEFPRGLCQHLKTEGYAYSVGASALPLANIGLVMLNLELTPKGAVKLQDCLTLIDTYLDFLRTSAVDPDWIAQQQNIVENNWKCLTFEASLEQGFNLCQALQAESLRTFPFHSEWPTQESVLLAQKALEQIHVDTGSKVLFVAENQEEPLSQPVENRVEPWSQTPYEIRSITPSKSAFQTVAWSKTLSNPFLPQTLPVFQQIEVSSSGKVTDTQLGPFIHYENAFCGGLKDSLYIAVQWNDQVMTHAKAFGCLFERSFNEKNYTLYQHAQEASQSLSLSREENGFSLSFTGYNTASGPKVIEQLFDAWLQFDLTPEDFERYKAELIENFIALDKGGPLDRFRSLAGAHLLENKYLPSQMVECLEPFTFDDFCKMHQQVLTLPLRFVMMGVSSREAEWTACFNRISKRFVNISKPATADFPKIPFPIRWKQTIPHELIDYHNQQEGNLAVFIWPITQEDSFTSSLSFEIFQPDLSSSAFNNLRSQQQLGYVVSASKASIGQTPVFVLLVLSSNKSQEQISKAMQEEVQLWQKQVLSFSKEAFETQKARLLREYKEPIETSLDELSLLLGLWPYGKDPKLTFEKLLLELENLSFESCQSALEKALSQAPYCIYSLPGKGQE